MQEITGKTNMAAPLPTKLYNRISIINGFSLTPAAANALVSTAESSLRGGPLNAARRAWASSSPRQSHPSERTPASHTARASAESHRDTNRCCSASITRTCACCRGRAGSRERQQLRQERCVEREGGCAWCINNGALSGFSFDLTSCPVLQGSPGDSQTHSLRARKNNYHSPLKTSHRTSHPHTHRD